MLALVHLLCPHYKDCNNRFINIFLSPGVGGALKKPLYVACGGSLHYSYLLDYWPTHLVSFSSIDARHALENTNVPQEALHHMCHLSAQLGTSLKDEQKRWTHGPTKNAECRGRWELSGLATTLSYLPLRTSALLKQIYL